MLVRLCILYVELRLLIDRLLTCDFFQLAAMPIAWIVRPILASHILSHPWVGGQLGQDERRYFQYADDQLALRIAEEEKVREEDGPNARKDMMHYLLHAKDPQTGTYMVMHIHSRLSRGCKTRQT